MAYNNLETCTHDDCEVIFVDSDNCELCDALKRVDELEKEISDAETEYTDIENERDELASDLEELKARLDQ